MHIMYKHFRIDCIKQCFSPQSIKLLKQCQETYIFYVFMKYNFSMAHVFIELQRNELRKKPNYFIGNYKRYNIESIFHASLSVTKIV